MALRTVIIYRPGLPEPAYPQDFMLEDDPRVARAIALGAERYSNGITLRVVIPGANHSTAYRHTLAESH